MTDMGTQTIEQLAAQYEDFSMDAKHRVLGEALYYLEVVERMHSIPGIEGVTITANMSIWCYPPPPYSDATESVQACLAGIWYMGRTQELLVLRGLPNVLWEVLDYLDMVAKFTDTRHLYGLVGVEVFTNDYIDYTETTVIEDVQQRLQYLMETLPIMREGYDTAKGEAPHGGLT